MEYRPVTDAEWAYLQRRFAALERRPGMRELFNNSLEGSPYDATQRRTFRREIFEQIRELASPRATYQNPYFELTWYRAVQSTQLSITTTCTTELSSGKRITTDP